MKRFISKYNTDSAFFKPDKFFFDKKAGFRRHCHLKK